MKRTLFIAIFLGVCLMPSFSMAATLTANQVSSIILLLQAFNVDQSTITSVYNELTNADTSTVAISTTTPSTQQPITIIINTPAPTPAPVFGAIDTPPVPMENLQFSEGWLPNNMTKECSLVPYNDTYGKLQSYWVSCQWVLTYSVDGKVDLAKINISIASTTILTKIDKSQTTQATKISFWVWTPQLLCQSDNNCPVTFTAGTKTLTSSMDLEK